MKRFEIQLNPVCKTIPLLPFMISLK